MRTEARHVPHVEVTTVDGKRVRYGDIWQRRNLTADADPELTAPAALIADRWGETSGETSRFPDIDELLSWVHFAEIQCPECPPY